MNADDISTHDVLWPSFSGPSQLAAIERVRLSDRGLPASTYELVRRAAELWPDRPAVSVLPDAESFHTPLVRTFGELAGDVHRAAAVLAELGVESRRRGRGRLGQLRGAASAAACRRGNWHLRPDQPGLGA